MDRFKRGSAPRTGPWNLTVREPLVQGPILNLIRLELVTCSIKSNRKFRYGSVSPEVSGSVEEITARGHKMSNCCEYVLCYSSLAII